MKAIQTHYLGYYFRSRLEARWAVFMETLQLRWRYEPEGFDLPSGYYLPDFLLEVWDDAGRGHWIEIKPTAPDPREERLVVELARATGKPTYLVAGQPYPGRFQCWIAEPGVTELREPGTAELGYGGMPEAWIECERDRHMGFSVDPADAYRRARSARFEHGAEPGLPLGWEGVEIVTGEPLEPEPIYVMWEREDNSDSGPTEASAA